MTPEEKLENFLHNLIEDFADEMGLYIVHHHRWVTSKNSNNAGARLANEWRPLLGPFAPVFGRWFAGRQTRRLAYLFSVAPGSAQFPATEALVNEISAQWLAAMEALVQRRSWLFGRFTAADAEIYGQWSMNLDDLSTNELMQTSAVNFHKWVIALRQGRFTDASALGPLTQLTPLLEIINRYFIPLMQQNLAAWQDYSQQGQKRFNEAAFNRGEALYSGSINGHAFRSVAKSFQAKRWLRRLDEWRALSAAERRQAINLGLSAFELAPNNITH